MLYTSGKLRRNVFISYVTIALLDSTCLWNHSSLRVNVYMHDIRVFTQVKGNGQFSHVFSQSVLFHKCFNGQFAYVFSQGVLFPKCFPHFCKVFIDELYAGLVA